MKLLSFACAFLLSLGLFAQDGLDDGLYAKFTTDKGVVIVALEFEKVPMTVANFVGLAEGKLAFDTVEVKEPYYDGMKFHRVIDNFMIQGGCPLGNGTGDPGYKFADEFDSTLTHKGPGILSMANSGANTNGSQFFITHKATPWLDGKHTVFGHVVSGQDVIDAIAKDDLMKTVEIIRIGKKAKKFKAHKIFPVIVAEKLEIIRKELEIRNKAFYTEMIKAYPNAIQTESGLMYEIVQEGKGVKPISGAEVEVHYTGTFPDGNKFDSSVDRGKKFKFMVDAGRVIKGWDEGVKLCDIGGKIKLILPYWLAYGESGRSAIPPKASLIFDIEVFGSSQDQ
jgi:peptidylprolyl isomerase